MHSSLKNIDLAVYNVNKHLKSVRHWFCRNSLICNTKNSKAMIIASLKALKTNRDINIFYGGSLLKQAWYFVRDSKEKTANNTHKTTVRYYCV